MEDVQITNALFLNLICACSLVGNTSLWIIVCRSRSLRTITNAFILSLSGTDLLVSIISMPFTVYAIIKGSWDLSETTCTASGYINMVTLTASIMSLCNISINRYIMVCRPTCYKRVYTKRNTAIMIIAAFGVSALLSSPPLYGWAQYSYIPMQHFCFCDWTKDKAYAFFMTGACFGVPFTVMLFCSIMIFRRVHDSQMKVIPELPVSTVTRQALEQAQHSLDSKLEKGRDTNPRKSNQRDEVSVSSRAVQVKNGKPESDQSFPRESALNRDKIQKDCSETVLHGEPNYCQTNGIIKDAKTFSVKSRTRRNDAQEIHMTVTLTVVLVIFFICWFPYCISVMLFIFYEEGVPRSFYVFTLMIAYFNSCCNPVIYGVMNKQFRDKFKQLFCSCKRNKNTNLVK